MGIYGFNEGWPAQVTGVVDESHDFDATIDAAEQAGLTDADRRANLVRVFAGFVADQTAFDAVAATAGLVSFDRARLLELDD